MHILYLHQHFALPSGSTGTRSYEFARRWVAQGHRVTIITGSYDLGGYPIKNKLFDYLSIDGIDVHIVGIRYSNKQSYVARILAFTSFMILCTWIALKVRQVDIVFATSTPLTIGIPAVITKWWKHIPFVFEVRDQWPAVPIGMGIIRATWLIPFLQLLEKWIYYHADGIIALSPGMEEGIRAVLEVPRPIAMVPNSSDTSLFHPEIDGKFLRMQRNWENKCVFLHFGTIGVANGIDMLVEVADHLRAEKDIYFVILGDGNQRKSIQEKITERKLDNIEIIASRPKSELPNYVAACDVSIVCFAPHPILQDNSANKFFDSLSAGKPILLNYSGWQRELLESHRAGFGVDQGNIEEFVSKVCWYRDNREVLLDMGRRSRILAEQYFNRDDLAGRVLEVLLAMCGYNTRYPRPRSNNVSAYS